MDNDIKLLVAAIEGLKSNIVKDYLFPMGSVFISTLLGAGVAYYSVDRQEKTKIEIKKIETINNLLFQANDLRSGLIAIKENYHGKINSNPIARMLRVPPIILSNEKIDFNFTDLLFISPKESDSTFSKWERVEYISTIFSNYNHLINIWQQRNSLIAEILPIIKQFGFNVDVKTLDTALGRGTIIQLSDLTEHVLHLTDELLIEISCFLVAFSNIGKTKVNKKAVKKFCDVISITLPDYQTQPIAVDLMSKVPELDYSRMSIIHGVHEQILRDRYRPLYQ